MKAVMSDVDAFVARGHEKVIAYYTWLRDTAQDAGERARFQQRIDAEGKVLRRVLERHAANMPRAA
jgi:hypothetical protein